MNAIEPISGARHDAKRVALLSDKAAALLSKLLDHLAGRNADNRVEAVAHVLRVRPVNIKLDYKVFGA